MRLILLGAPGAGKGTQAEILSRELGIAKISTGSILRAAIKDGTPVGLRAKKYMDAGQLVDDATIMDILCQRIACPDCENGFILDGVPRTIPQAQAIEELGIEINAVISLEVEDEVIVKRVSGRRVCKDCSHPYHVDTNPPRQEGVCDLCGGELHIRKDDAPETVLKRLDTYHELTKPLKDFYQQRGMLKVVENSSSIEATTAKIFKALEITR